MSALDTQKQSFTHRGSTLLSEDRFWSHVDKSSKGCWVWTAGKSDGYGMFALTTTTPSVTILAHRYSWQIHFGEIPKGLFICHACDNRACVNPKHLWMGTHQANDIDRDRKGRQKPTPGFSGLHHSDEYKHHMSEVMRGNTNPLGHKHSEETIRKLSEARTRYWNEKRKRNEV